MLEPAQSELNRIPGYAGYRSKERRRDDDRAVRNQLADDLDASAAQVETIGRDLANQRRLDAIQPVESLFRQVGHLANRVRTAPSGYAGLYDEREIDELALDQLRRFDEQAAKEASTLAEQVTALQRAAANAGDFAPALGMVVDEVSRLSALWDGRTRVIETARPSPESELVSLLDPASPTAAASQAIVLNVGDAFAIYDRNAIVTATLRIATPPHEVVLARMDSGPDWLFLLQGETTRAATVTETPDDPQPEGTVLVDNPGRSKATDHAGATAEAAVLATIVESGAEAGRESSIWVGLDWGTQRRQYSGTIIHLSDLETFGRPSE